MTTTQQKPMLAVSIRWMIRRDMPDVLAIESHSFQFPWLEDDFIRHLRQRNIIGMVAEDRQRTVGYMIYELCKQRLFIVNLAVHEDCRFKCVGRQMVHKLITKLSHDRRSRLVVNIRETNLDAQLFFKRMGFEAVDVLRDHYEDVSEDAYRFVYRHREGQP